MGKVNRTAPKPMSRARRKAAVEEVLTGQAPSPVSLSVAIQARKRKSIIDAMLGNDPRIPDGAKLLPLSARGGGGAVYGGGRPSAVADDPDAGQDDDEQPTITITQAEYELLERLVKIALKNRERKAARKR